MLEMLRIAPPPVVEAEKEPGPESKAEGEEKKAERSTTRQDTMINDEGQNVDLYIPRKW